MKTGLHFSRDFGDQSAGEKKFFPYLLHFIENIAVLLRRKLQVFHYTILNV